MSTRSSTFLFCFFLGVCFKKVLTFFACKNFIPTNSEVSLFSKHTKSNTYSIVIQIFLY